MAMDVIRSAYRCEMRMYEDSDVLTKVRWYRCAPSARFFPGYHRFASANWAHDKEAMYGPGEVSPFPRPYSKLAGPEGVDGTHYCGPLRAFMSGARMTDPSLTVSALGVPLCCLEAEPQGVVLDGDSVFVHGSHTQQADGGGWLDGSAEFPVPHVQYAAGGLLIGGSALFPPNPHVQTASGGVWSDGSADFLPVHLQTADGGVLVDGNAYTMSPHILSANGGVLLDSQVYADHVQLADGGVLLDGIMGTPFLASGGVLLDGSLVRPFLASGGVILDGTLVRPFVASGGVLLDGAGNFFIYTCAKCSTGAPFTFFAMVGPISNGTCGDCSNLSGVIPLPHQIACQWISADIPVCGNTAQWVLTYQMVGDVWIFSLLTTAMTYAEYRCAGAAFDCSYGGLFTLFASVGPGCTGFPPSVLISA